MFLSKQHQFQETKVQVSKIDNLQVQSASLQAINKVHLVRVRIIRMGARVRIRIGSKRVIGGTMVLFCCALQLFIIPEYAVFRAI